MKALKRKAASQKGASITFALLLFLVCAVVSSVVIVAATAVSGRASKIAEMDQRYYAVNSAAELLRSELEAPTVTITTGKKTVSTVDQDENVPDGTTPVTTDLTPNMVLNNEATISSDDESLVATAAMKLAGLSATLPTSLSLSVSGTTDPDALSVTMEPVMASVGSNEMLQINVHNSDPAKGVYTLRLTFKADITKSNNERTTYGAPIPERDLSGKLIEGQYTREKTEEKTTVTTIRWKMIDLQTVTDALTTNPGGGA